MSLFLEARARESAKCLLAAGRASIRWRFRWGWGGWLWGTGPHLGCRHLSQRVTFALQVLAINRGENLKILTVKVNIPDRVKSEFCRWCVNVRLVSSPPAHTVRQALPRPANTTERLQDPTHAHVPPRLWNGIILDRPLQQGLPH